MWRPPDPEKRNPAAGQGNGGIVSQSQFQHRRHYRISFRNQAFWWLVSKFVVVAALAWGVAR